MGASYRENDRGSTYRGSLANKVPRHRPGLAPSGFERRPAMGSRQPLRWPASLRAISGSRSVSFTLWKMR
jgi:hypothetical protein